MINILYIGQYKEGGRFTTIQWRYFMEWCKTECNKIFVYSKMPYITICNRFPLYCKIGELETPDEEQNVYAYEIDVGNVEFWNYIKEFNYSIDVDDISHLFFFCEKRHVASLEIVDYENYVLIEEPVDQIEIFLIKKELVIENIQFCAEGKSDIDELLQEESWRPLGIDLGIPRRAC